LSSEAGYICWYDLHKIYDNDTLLPANLRRAPKLTYTALHPGNNKQNVDLAISVFHESTIAGCKSYFPSRTDMSTFLELILNWWTIANSRQRFTPNLLSNGITFEDGKLDFYESFADWIESWATISDFCLSKQTAKALVLTLRSQAMLIKDLFNEDYTYFLTRRLQSDPIENRFSQYRQMSGGRFLVSQREVISSERILICRSLLKEGINFWEEESLRSDHNVEPDILCHVKDYESEIFELSLSRDSSEVAYTIAGYVSKKLHKCFKCEVCKTLMHGSDSADLLEKKYFDLLSRGGLTVPSNSMAEFVCASFSILDYVDEVIMRAKTSTTRVSAELILQTYAPKSIFTCEKHRDDGYKFTSRIVTNIFYNNKQKIAADEVRKNSVVEFKRRQRSK
jgi:hypothetical protein